MWHHVLMHQRSLALAANLSAAWPSHPPTIATAGCQAKPNLRDHSLWSTFPFWTPDRSQRNGRDTHLGLQHVNLKSTDQGQKNARGMHLGEQHVHLKWPDRGQRNARSMHLGMRECPGQYWPGHMLKKASMTETEVLSPHTCYNTISANKPSPTRISKP